jgi:hypothetical protein
MQLKLILTILVALGTTAAAMNSAEARRYRQVDAYASYAVSDTGCSYLPPSFLYIYPTANWEPFFRRHVYRYGPLYTGCTASAQTTNLVSVRY